MSDIQKGRVFKANWCENNVVKVLDIVDNDCDPRVKVVIFRKVKPMTKKIYDEIITVEFDFLTGHEKTWLPMEAFQEEFELFVADLETIARIREGFYDKGY